MAARSMWKGVVSFGMVSIPVRLHSATEKRDVSFHQLHGVCKGRLRHRLWCPVCDRAVERDEVVRGYEYAKDQYVVVTDEDLDDLPVASKHTIELAAFVRAESIDPVFHEKTYYLEPEPTGVKPYQLLVRALKKKELAGVASLALRQRERLCTVRTFDGGLAVDTLLYPDEVRPKEKSAGADLAVSERELDLALNLVDALTEEFDPAKFGDRYRAALLERIEAKIHGKDGTAAAPTPLPTPVDLMAALRASVAAVQAKPKKEAVKTPRRRAKAA